MFNNKYKPYQPVPHCDSGDEIELNDVSPQSNNKITNLLKLTAHRRIRQHTEDTSTDNIIHINDDHSDDEHTHTESTHLINRTTSNDLDDVDLNDAHADSQSEGEQSVTDLDTFDDYVFLLFLDGTKKRVGIMKTWRIWNVKDKYFKQELQNGSNVRLIYRGKLLQDALSMTQYNIPSDGFIHVSISKNGYKQTYGSDMANNNLEDGEINYDNFDDGIDDEAMARMLQQREMNMFGGNVGNNERSEVGDGRANEPMDANRARREFLCGMFLGSVAGIWILIFLILAQRRTYSRRFRLGVTLGVAINLMIQISYQYPNMNGDGSEAEEAAGNATETEQTDIASQEASIN